MTFTHIRFYTQLQYLTWALSIAFLYSTLLWDHPPKYVENRCGSVGISSDYTIAPSLLAEHTASLEDFCCKSLSIVLDGREAWPVASLVRREQFLSLVRRFCPRRGQSVGHCTRTKSILCRALRSTADRLSCHKRTRDLAETPSHTIAQLGDNAGFGLGSGECHLFNHVPFDDICTFPSPEPPLYA